MYLPQPIFSASPWAGGALTVARGALSSWWSSLATPEETSPPAEPATDAARDAETALPPAGSREQAESTRHPAQTPAEYREQAESVAAGQGEPENRPGRPRFECVETVEGQSLPATVCP